MIRAFKSKTETTTHLGVETAYGLNRRSWRYASKQDYKLNNFMEDRGGIYMEYFYQQTRSYPMKVFKKIKGI